MDLAEVRPALGRLPAERVLPDAGGHTVSRVVSALLEAEEPLSTAGLAERAGVSAQSVRDNREMLEAFGLVFVEDGGAGKSNWWRVRLPFESERFQNRDVEQREADEYLRIPMYGFVESFNISVSCAITLHHLVYRLKGMPFEWKLTDEEQEELLLAWMRRSIKRWKTIEEEWRNSQDEG